MEKIGFIGLGIMGKPMVQNLLKANYSATVHDLNRDVVGHMVKEGATAARSGRMVADNSDVVITMLPDSPQVEEVLFGPEGVSEGLRTGMLFIDMSTIAPAVSRKIHRLLAGKGVAALDAPVSGGEIGARAGSLSIMVGGDERAFERAMPFFQVLGRNIVRVGDAGAGQVTKACNQMIVGMTIQAVAEAMILARKANVDLDKVREALLGGFANSRILDVHGKRIIEGDFQPGFRIQLHRKDLNIALQTGRELSVPLMGTSLVASQMDSLIARGKGDLDHSALALLLAQLADVSLDK